MLIVKFLSSTPWTAVRFIKLKSPTVKERYTHQTGAGRNSQWRHCTKTQASYQQPALGCGDESLQTFLSLSLSPYSPLVTYLYADGVFWLNARMAVLPQYCSHIRSSLGYFGVVEKLWLTPGRNPLAATIYREGTQSHLHLQLMRDRNMKKEWEKAWRIQSISEINNLSSNLSNFFPGQIKEEKVRGKKRGCSVRETSSRFFFFSFFLFFPINIKEKETSPEMRRADPNWIKSIWILLSLLFLQCTRYYPPFPVTVSWAVCITQLLIKILRSYSIDSCAAIIEPPMQNNNVPCCNLCRWKRIFLKAWLWRKGLRESMSDTHH